MQITAVGWEVYSLTGQAFDLGLISLIQILPFFLLFPLSGRIAEHLPRTRIMVTGVSFQALYAASFFILTLAGVITTTFSETLAILAALGIARAFQPLVQ